MEGRRLHSLFSIHLVLIFVPTPTGSSTSGIAWTTLSFRLPDEVDHVLVAVSADTVDILLIILGEVGKEFDGCVDGFEKMLDPFFERELMLSGSTTAHFALV